MLFVLSDTNMQPNWNGQLKFNQPIGNARGRVCRPLLPGNATKFLTM